MSQKNNTVTLMTEGNVSKLILQYALPIFVGSLFQQLYSTVDALIVGNLVGENALAAITSVSSFTYLLVGFFMGFSTGAGVIVAREVGANHYENTQKAVHTTVALGLVISVLMTVIGIGITPWMLRFMESPTEILPLSQQYLTIYFAGSFGLVMYDMLVGIIRAGGDSKHPFYYLVISSILNVILDFLFIGIFHMGVSGAAIGTVIAQFVSAIMSWTLLTRSDSILTVHPRSIRFDIPLLKEIIAYGLPTALQGCVIDLANLLIQSYINTFGSATIAGIGASQKVEGFIFLPVTSFSMALTTFISQNLGANKHQRVKDGILFGLTVSTVIIELMGIIVYLFAPAFIQAFNSNPEVIEQGVLRARTVALFYGLLGFSHVTSAVQRGVGKPVLPMIVMVTCWCAVRVIVLYTIGQSIHDIHLTHWIYPITWGLSTIVDLIWLHSLHLFQKESPQKSTIS